MESFKFLKKEKLERLPKSPGVYVFSASAPTKSELRRIRRSLPIASAGGKKGREFLNAEHSRFLTKSRFLYIGKASNIKERVKNHFQRPTSLWEQVLNKKTLLRQGFGGQGKIGYLKTNSEIEALILEANLIKKYRPKYNVTWKDDKNYFFVAITKGDFPRVFITHQLKNKLEIGNQPFGEFLAPLGPGKLEINYIGPFVDGKVLKQTLKILRKVFPYRSCKTLPKRPCLWYQLGRCPAPCLLKSPKDPPPKFGGGPTGQAKLAEQIPSTYFKMRKECQENTKNLIKILQGKKKHVLKDLKRGMKKASDLEDFERAAKIRDQIIAFERVLAHSKIFTEVEVVLKKPEKEWLSIQKTLQNILKTRQKISRIEAYDVSNIQGKLATGSMVTFLNGKVNKNFYRRFKIKISDKPNDIAMINEVLKRRLKHLEWSLPDLILIDGGRAQLNAAINILNQQKLAKSASISVFALAKKKNELFVEGKKDPILLKDLPRGIFNLILQLRDEAHRFAISYHRKLRKKKLLAGK